MKFIFLLFLSNIFSFKAFSTTQLLGKTHKGKTHKGKTGKKQRRVRIIYPKTIVEATEDQEPETLTETTHFQTLSEFTDGIKITPPIFGPKSCKQINSMSLQNQDRLLSQLFHQLDHKIGNLPEICEQIIQTIKCNPKILDTPIPRDREFIYWRKTIETLIQRELLLSPVSIAMPGAIFTMEITENLENAHGCSRKKTRFLKQLEIIKKETF